MGSAQVARPRARSPFAAAFLSLLFPGLGHAYVGAYWRAVGFAAPPLLVAALLGGLALRANRFELVGFLLQPPVLTSILVVDALVLVYRIVATIDAYRVAAYLNAYERSGSGRFGPPRLFANPVSVGGLLAVILVGAGGHAVVARYDLAAMEFVSCVFDESGEADCQEPGPSASPDPGASGTLEPLPTETPSEPGQSSSSPIGTAVPNATLPPWDGRERLNILLVGADEQEGGHNTDTLIVVSIDPGTRQVAMFSLPRDTVDVPIPAGPARSVFGSVYRSKINSWFVSVRGRADLFPGNDRQRGYNGLKAILGELYQLDIRWFVEVNFEGFRKVVDAMGGVTVNVQVPVVDDRFPDPSGWLRRIYIPAGVQHMTGDEALVYARSRNTSTDFDRGQRQQRVLLSLREQTDVGRLLPRLDALIDAMKQAVRTDIPVSELPELLSLADEIDTRAIRSYVFSPPRYQREFLQSARGYIIVPNLERIRAAVKAAFRVDPAAEERREAIASEGAEVWVLNGSGRDGEAARLAGYLESEGMNASAPNQKPDRNPRTTVITVHNGAEVRLLRTIAFLEATFGVEVGLANDQAARADVIVIAGRDTPQLTPPPAP